MARVFFILLASFSFAGGAAADDEKIFEAQNLSDRAAEIAGQLGSGQTPREIDSELELGEVSQRLAWELDKSVVQAGVESAVYSFAADDGKQVFALNFMPYDRELVIRAQSQEGLPLDTGIKLPLGQPGPVKTLYSIAGGYSLHIFMPRAVKRNFTLLGCVSAPKSKDFKGVRISGARGDVSGRILGKSPVGFGVSEMHAYLRTTRNVPPALKYSDFDFGKMASLKLRYEPAPNIAPDSFAEQTRVGVSAEFTTKNPAGYLRREIRRDVLHAYPVAPPTEDPNKKSSGPKSCFLFLRENVHSSEYLKEEPPSPQP